MEYSEFAGAIGAEHVIMESARLAAAGAATYPTAHRVPAILRPGSRHDVEACVRIAARTGTRIYPISRGRNWGYGSAAPFAANCVVLDLSRMNRIVDYDDRLGYVVVEPGVTQQQLAAFLDQQGGKFWMDASGSSPDGSLVGNILERGFGHTPYGDHFANCCCFEVVLPSGEVIETGLGAFPGAKAKHTYRWGAGPALDGLFSQSRFGIVTRLTIWLMPAPEAFEAFFLKSTGEQSLPLLVETLRDLRLQGTLNSSVHLVNGYRVLSGIGQYPWTEMNGATPLPPSRLKGFAKEIGFGDWNGSGGIYGAAPMVAQMRKLLKKALRGKVSSLNFVNDKKLAFAKRHSRVLSPIAGINLSRTLALLEPAFELLKGRASHHSLRSVYWRKRSEPPADPNPDRDRCGLLWSAPVAPADGPSAVEVAAIAESVLLEGGFEPLLSFTLATPRSLICVISIVYDREDAGEDERAMRCSSKLNERLGASGYQPYRLGIHSMGAWNTRTHSAGLAQMQSALDPKGIFSPGHYDLT